MCVCITAHTKYVSRKVLFFRAVAERDAYVWGGRWRFAATRHQPALARSLSPFPDTARALSLLLIPHGPHAASLLLGAYATILAAFSTQRKRETLAKAVYDI